MISSCSANPDHHICTCRTLDRLGAGLCFHHKKLLCKSQGGVTGQGSNTGACRWDVHVDGMSNMGRSRVLADTMCHSHQLSPRPGRHTLLPCSRKHHTTPSFHCCPRQWTFPQCCSRATLPAGLTDNLPRGHLLGWITQFFSLWLIKTLP